MTLADEDGCSIPVGNPTMLILVTQTTADNSWSLSLVVILKLDCCQSLNLAHWTSFWSVSGQNCPFQRHIIHYYWVSIVFVVCKYSLLWNEMKLCWNSVWFIVSFHFISLSESAKRGNVYCSISRLQMYSIIRAINLNNIVWNTKPFWSFRKREIYNWNWISCEIKFLSKLPV